jgi:hypothetical protein
MAGPLGEVSVDNIIFNKTGHFAVGLPCPFMAALLGLGAVSDLSPLTVPKQTLFSPGLAPRSLQKARGPETGLWASESIGKGQPPEIRREFYPCLF